MEFWTSGHTGQPSTTRFWRRGESTGLRERGSDPSRLPSPLVFASLFQGTTDPHRSLAPRDFRPESSRAAPCLRRSLERSPAYPGVCGACLRAIGPPKAASAPRSCPGPTSGPTWAPLGGSTRVRRPRSEDRVRRREQVRRRERRRVSPAPPSKSRVLRPFSGSRPSPQPP